MQVARLTAAAQVTTIGVVAATAKVEVQLCDPLASVTVYVNDRLTPVQAALAGRGGTEAMLVVAMQPPVNEKPATHAVYEVCRAASLVQVGRLTATGQLTTIGVAGATTKVEVQPCEPQASVTVYVNDRLTPVVKAVAGSTGIVARLVVALALHPPL